MDPIWNARQVLGLDPVNRITCVGLIQNDERHCGRQVAEKWRDAASKILDEMDQISPSNSTVLRGMVKQVAEKLLCRAWHGNPNKPKHNQVDRYTLAWMARIAIYAQEQQQIQEPIQLPTPPQTPPQIPVAVQNESPHTPIHGNGLTFSDLHNVAVIIPTPNPPILSELAAEPSPNSPFVETHEPADGFSMDDIDGDEADSTSSEASYLTPGLAPEPSSPGLESFDSNLEPPDSNLDRPDSDFATPDSDPEASESSDVQEERPAEELAPEEELERFAETSPKQSSEEAERENNSNHEDDYRGSQNDYAAEDDFGFAQVDLTPVKYQRSARPSASETPDITSPPKRISYPALDTSLSYPDLSDAHNETIIPGTPNTLNTLEGAMPRRSRRRVRARNSIQRMGNWVAEAAVTTASQIAGTSRDIKLGFQKGRRRWLS